MKKSNEVRLADLEKRFAPDQDGFFEVQYFQPGAGGRPELITTKRTPIKSRGRYIVLTSIPRPESEAGK
jgi:hypothetical protein